MFKKNILPVILAHILFASFPIIFSSCLLGDDIETLRSKVEIIVPGATFTEKLDWVKSNMQSGGNYVIEFTEDETISPIKLEYGENPNITIILRGIGANRTISLSSDGEIYIHKGVTLILDDNITLVGSSSNDKPLVKAGYDATFIMKSGSTITGNTTAYFGGVLADGTFIMTGGTISGNNKGVFVGRSNGTFIMSGGTISGNTDSGVDVDGDYTHDDGTYDAGGTFIMSGGTISGNTANSGGGVRGRGTITMSGGTISGNTADYGGGGVYVNGAFIDGKQHFRAGIFTMSGGTISGNTANSGGGVYVDGTFTKTGGTITGYASDTVNGNVVKDNDGNIWSHNGHAVYAYRWNQSSQTGIWKRRETTAGPEVNLSFNGEDGTFSGAWED